MERQFTFAGQEHQTGSQNLAKFWKKLEVAPFPMHSLPHPHGEFCRRGMKKSTISPQIGARLGGSLADHKLGGFRIVLGAIRYGIRYGTIATQTVRGMAWDSSTFAWRSSSMPL
jgi:hypothetical protein